MSESILPSGAQWTLRYGAWEAVVVEVGGGLRILRHAGRDVVAGYPAAQSCSAGRGQHLAPWPNRIAQGRYDWAGEPRQLVHTEPERAGALHGLLAWQPWQRIDEEPGRLVVGTRLHPQPGWGWTWDVRVTYRLDDSGLTVIPHVTNLGPTPSPCGYGAHPYLTAGEDRVDEVTLELPARTLLPVEEGTLVPARGARPEVVPAHFDFTSPRLLGDTEVDVTFTDLSADDDGCWRVHVGAGDRTTTLWAPAAPYPWLQVFTGDTLPAAQARRSGVAVEPMTCPPDAFNNGIDLHVLDPGGSWEAPWGIAASER